MKDFQGLALGLANRELLRSIPDEEFEAVMEQKNCELTRDFLGFTNVYYAVRAITPTTWTIVDFGCNLAAQAYLFRDYARYIGVDMDIGRRFRPPNALHLVGSISQCLPDVERMVDKATTFAICSYVPSFQTALVRTAFPNCLVFYPHEEKEDEI